MPGLLNSAPLCSWVDATFGMVPENAVRAGTDHGNQPVYAGRAIHEGDLLPAKVAPAFGCAFVPWGGREHSKLNYEVLTTTHTVKWISDSNGKVPDGAVPVGITVDGEDLYMGRAAHNGTLLPGKIHPSRRCMYLPYGDLEHPYTNYEVLVISYN